MSGIDPNQFRSYIVLPTLNMMQATVGIRHTLFADDLLVATAAQESGLGHYLHQTGKGPAVGIYQIEPATLADLLGWIYQRPELKSLVNKSAVSATPAVDETIWNLRYATIIARLNYFRRPEALPSITTFETLWHCYKTYWNTSAGAATEGSFRTALRLTDIKL
jgi:hypothetical protein